LHGQQFSCGGSKHLLWWAMASRMHKIQ
jgi:hypothetical protein